MFAKDNIPSPCSSEIVTFYIEYRSRILIKEEKWVVRRQGRINETGLANTGVGIRGWRKTSAGTACSWIYTRASNFLIAFPSDIFMVDYSGATIHPHPVTPGGPETISRSHRTYTARTLVLSGAPKLNESGLLHGRTKTCGKYNCRHPSSLSLPLCSQSVHKYFGTLLSLESRPSSG